MKSSSQRSATYASIKEGGILKVIKSIPDPDLLRRVELSCILAQCNVRHEA